MPRKKAEIAKDDKEFLVALENLFARAKPTFKIKLCCHAKDMPEVCGVYELPFKPENGDIICVKPPKEENTDTRISFVVNNLVYDIEKGQFVMNAGVIKHIQDTNRLRSELNTEVDPLK